MSGGGKVYWRYHRMPSRHRPARNRAPGPVTKDKHGWGIVPSYPRTRRSRTGVTRMRHIGEDQRGARRFFVMMLASCVCIAQHPPAGAAQPLPNASAPPNAPAQPNATTAVNKPDNQPAGAQPATEPAEAGKDQTFPVMEYRVLGNTSLPVIDVERAVYPFLGPQRAMKDIEA